MKTLITCFSCVTMIACAADQMTVIVSNDLDAPRPSETISVPWHEIAKRLPGTLPNKIMVKDSGGRTVPCQLINPKPDEHQDHYESIIFQHDFAPGERQAVFTLEKSATPVPPHPSKVFARHVPERYDDFAWENDRVAFRIYGPGLALPSAGRSRMTSSGMDVWCKRVPYPVIDRWYLMGHYHDDTGEGLDLYEVAKSRGCGGTGVWDGKELFVSDNWATAKVLANGPVRVVFEVTYGPWDAGSFTKVSETRRISLDAGSHFNEVESTFSWESSGATPMPVAIGIAKHVKNISSAEAHPDEKGGCFSLWEKYEKNGQLGTAVVIPEGRITGFAEDPLNHLVLTKVASGEPLRYHTGACWDGGGGFTDHVAWQKHLAAYVERLNSPLRISFPSAE